jgi:threonyl-tRNA synthetase
MKVHLPDGTELELDDDASGADAARAIGEGLARAALGIRVGGELRDLSVPLSDGDRIEIVTSRDDDGLWLLRHDAAHVLATAVMELYPGVKISIGPPIEDGFYYDFDFPDGTKLTEDDFERVEQRMREHIGADERFERTEVPVAEAIERFKGEGQDYKVELIEDLVRNADPAQPVETVSLYRNGPFTDLCRGPHGPGTKRIKAMKLTSVAGAYWRGDASRPMLTRVYGTAFASKDDLQEHLHRLEQARERDHRKLGRELSLFMLSDLSPGSPFWLPKGTHIWNELTRLWRTTNVERGYQEVRSPILFDQELWKQSGHWHVYRDHMYFTDVEERPMGLKPMNCPGHCQIYKRELRSYRDLPLRLAEQGLVHRHEPSGTLHGLLRVRHITQDDAHVFCTEEQIEEEAMRCLDFGFYIYEQFGLEPRLELSTRPEKRVGTDEMWDKAEAALARTLEKNGLEYDLNEGDGAFYGPKIDAHITDAIGRSWQLGTVQLDYYMPEQFELAYTGADNAEHRPVMIHRALMGSFERFIGILIEHYAGEFPLWLAPVHAMVLPIADRHLDYAREVATQLREAGLRVEVDERSESIGKKIREAEVLKVPYMLVVGDEEREAGAVAVRRHREGDLGPRALDDFARPIADEIAERR